ncbi:MAG TPA: helix-turn-helix transcriptional regulator [Chthoniobacterales bacterium]|nr:helix-turn-helix transcriptional regulator [Chthoniobacterales bacterium]
MSANKKNKYRGSDFDDFLKEEGIYEDVCALAVKRIIATQVAASLKECNKSVADLAKEMKTSRAAVNRLLDERNYSVSLRTLAKTASALGKRLNIELVAT